MVAEFAIFFLLGALCPVAKGLFDDQAGKFDWRQQFVGKVDFLFWDQSHSLGKRILVGTDKNAIAAINAHNGSIAWRQILEEDGQGKIDVLLHQGNNLVSLSGGGKFIRSWVPGSGNLHWEMVVPSDSSGLCGAALLGYPKVESILSLSLGILYNFKASDGSELWRVNLPDRKNVEYRYLTVNDRDIYVIGQTVGSHVTVVLVNPEGKVKFHTVLSAWLSPDDSCLTIQQNFICYDSSSRSLWLLQLTGEGFIPSTLQDIGITEEVTDLEKVASDEELSHNALVLLKLNSKHEVIVNITGSDVALVQNIQKAHALQISKVGDKIILISLERIDSETLKLSGYDLFTQVEATDLSHKISQPSSYGYPTKIDALLFIRKDGRLGYKLIVHSEDYSLQLVHRSGRVAWRREEALAYILAVEMVDLPVSETQAKFEDEFGSQHDDVLTMFMKRLSTQVAQIKTLARLLIQRLQGHRHHHTASLEDDDDELDEEEEEEELTRDEFNLQKIVITVTAAGKIFGLRSSNGKIIWQHYLPDLAPFHKFNRQTFMLYVQRTTAHISNPPQCSVLGRHKKTGEGLLYTFHPVTGKPVDMSATGRSLGYRILQASMLNEVNANFLKGFIILDAQLQVHTYPASFLKIIKKILSTLFLYIVDPDEGQMLGYRLVYSQGKLVAQKVWNVNLQKSLQVITNVVPKRPTEHVHSQGRALGDRSVLYKYLDPNLVVVTAEGEEPPSTSQKGPLHFLNIYMIDVVTGNIVFHANHRRAKGPVHVVHSENWLVYNYYNQKNRRNEMAVLELYEGKSQSNSTAFSSFSPPPQPLVTRQAYIFPAHLATMTTTITEKGITSKHLIVALKFGGLLSLPKAFLDPRRPVTPTQHHMEEGTIPYVPEIPINVEAILNYNKSVYCIQGIQTAPAGLESTSLLLAYGIDLFYTRVMPSKMFDVLKDDFDYLFISSVLIGMIAVSVASQKLAARKALNRAWR